jgi:hypothetical protein
MGNDLDAMTYMIAAEKMVNLLFVMEQTLEFLEEYKIQPDDEVKKALMPMIKQLSEWSAK